MARYLLSVAELGRIIGRSRQTVHRMVKEGELPFEAVPGLATTQFRRADVEAWLGCAVAVDELEAAS